MPGSELLRRTPLFGNLSVDDWVELGTHLSPRRFAAGLEDKPRSASAIATTEAVLLGLSRSTIISFLEHRPHAVMPSGRA